jgi:CheY-like chemotaxis protein
MSNRKTILVVDDDREIQEAIQLALPDDTYQVVTASNGSEAIRVLENIQRPALVLLDLLMPEMSGWDFLQEKKRNPALDPLSVVIITAFAEKARSLPAVSVLKKPFTRNELLHAVERFSVTPPNPFDVAI